MSERIVRTVRGDIPPADLGFVLAHEHLLARPTGIDDSDLVLGSEAEAERELLSFRQAGGGTLVEMTTIDYGRDGSGVQRLSETTGIHVVAATGFNKAKLADRISSRHGTVAIADWMVREIDRGMIAVGTKDLAAPPATPTVRAGLIKASSSLDGPTPDERRVFDAAAAAQLATGAPISTHTEKGTWALEQALLFTEAGVPADKVLLSHLDFKPDVGYLAEVLATGVSIGLDQFGKAKYLPDADRLALVEGLAARGHLRRIMLSGDMARRSSWVSTGGGPGLRHIPTMIRDALKARGFGEADLALLFHGNAARWLAFAPRLPPST